MTWGCEVERMKIIIIDFSFAFAFFDIRCMERKNRTGEYEREREREGRKERENYLMCIPLHFPSHYLPTWYLRLQWLLYFASLYFTFYVLSNAAKNYIGT